MLREIPLVEQQKELARIKRRPRPAAGVFIPMTEYVPRKGAMSQFLLAAAMGEGDMPITSPRVAAVATVRNDAVRAFLEVPHLQFLLMFDADMVMPQNIIDIWVGNPSYRFPFISGYCTKREPPYTPTASRYMGVQEQFGASVHVYSPMTGIEPDTGIHVVDGVGAAAICVRRDVLEAIEPPWFAFDEGGGGEDYYFCRKVEAVKTHDAPNGVPILVDSHVQIGHIGDHVAYPSTFFERREAWLRESGEEEQLVQHAPKDYLVAAD